MTKLIERLKIVRLANKSTDWQARILLSCENDIIFFINNFCWTKDPRPGKDAKIIPFIAYEFQETFILKIVHNIIIGKDLLIEKSRDMGATWCFLYVFLWFWLFKNGYDFLLGSQTQTDVDQSGNPKSLFPRLRMNLERLPDWMLPSEFQDNFLRLVNEDQQNTIVGESSINFSRQGRYSASYMDEFAFWNDSGRTNSDEMAWTAAGDATPCRLLVSSAHGKNNKFYRLREQKDSEIEVLRLHWKLHPYKNQAWYEAEKRRRSKSELAAEVGIDYSASVKNRAAENFDNNIHVLSDEEWRYDPKVELQLAFDFNIDPMCWQVSEFAKGIDITFKEYSVETTVTESVIRQFCVDFANHKNKIVYLYGDRSGHSGGTRSRATDYDIIKRVLRDHQWTYYDHTFNSNPKHSVVINAINKRLKDWENNNKPMEFILHSCENLIDSLESTQAKDDGLIKDGIEHHYQAFGYRVAKKYPAKKQEMIVRNRR